MNASRQPTLATDHEAPALRAGQLPAALADNRPQAAQRQLPDAIAASPRQVAQRQQLAAIAASPRQVAQRQQQALPPPANRTGLPDELKAGVEHLSGHSLDDVRVHYNSPQAAQLQAAAYAQGTAIHVGPGQEKHLPHEAWHVVQQKQGRVRPTRQLKGRVPVNDEQGLEKEADQMGTRALTAPAPAQPAAPAAPGTAPGGAVSQLVVQRVYLSDAAGIRFIPPTDDVPPGYHRTGNHDDGTHGPASLYQPMANIGASTNPFFAHLGYGNAEVADSDIRPDDPAPETSVDKINQHYASQISGGLGTARKRKIAEKAADVDSSDSETEAGMVPEHQVRRRHYKASQLTAIARTMHPLTPEEELFRQKVNGLRKRDNDANPGKRQMYAPDTRKSLAQIGEQFKLTNFEHNPYYRRGFAQAIPTSKVEKGGSAAYDASQGAIRTGLHRVIAADDAKMKWQRADFPTDQDWEDFQYMKKNALSNASKGDTYHDRAKAGQDTSGSQARIGFHHITWKEAHQAAFEGHALNPYNLTALSDMREIINPAKLKRLKEAGKQPPPVGAHDAYGHQLSGFRADEKSKYSRSKGGGQFKDIDLEATDQILKPSLEPRAKKRKLYQVSKPSATTPTPTGAPATTVPTGTLVPTGAPTTAVTPATTTTTGTPTPVVATATPLTTGTATTTETPTTAVTTATPSLTKAPPKQVQRWLAGVRDTAQRLLAALPANQGSGPNADIHGFSIWLQGFIGALPLADASSPGFVAWLRSVNGHLNTTLRSFSARLNRGMVSQPGNALGAEGERLPALEQFFAECGQMAAHNALMLAAFPALNTPPALFDNNQLSQFGNLQNNISEEQIRAIVAGAGRPDIPVLGNTQQVRGVVQLLQQGDAGGLIANNISPEEQIGATALYNFAHRFSNSLVLVVNTESHQDYGSQGLHWITVRLRRQFDGQIAVQYLDSLAAMADYRALFTHLRAFLGHVPPQPLAPGGGPPPGPSADGSGSSAPPDATKDSTVASSPSA